MMPPLPNCKVNDTLSSRWAKNSTIFLLLLLINPKLVNPKCLEYSHFHSPPLSGGSAKEENTTHINSTLTVPQLRD